ncbi:unnamed protein product [Arctia plantaginis]|uniref:Uncharacterized protein n=1 Tax=Arctia plantaginis TaxID=874455 RepID=A0A8S1BMF8_ARCPL|nr:unnamed protein product [Arctia plantaginis]
MFKLLSFLLVLAAALAAPAHGPGALQTPITYSNGIAYNPFGPAFGYAAVPAPITYNGPIIASYPAPHIAYANLGY